MQNPWDKVSDIFNTFKENPWRGAADNIATVWPVVLEYIQNNFPETKGLKALDFGCGAGSFCEELLKRGFKTYGIDSSKKMITIAKENLNPKIKVFCGNTATAKEQRPFDFISAIMVLQFIADEELGFLLDSMNKNSHIIFANHSLPRLKERRTSDFFTLTDTELKVPIYKRSPADWDKIFLTHGFQRTLENYPEDSEEFKKHYNMEKTYTFPKYMILAYKKIV